MGEARKVVLEKFRFEFRFRKLPVYNISADLILVAYASPLNRNISIMKDLQHVGNCFLWL